MHERTARTISSLSSVACIALCGMANATAIAQDAPSAAARPAYSVVRDEEDWTAVRSSPERVDPYDALKYVPLGKGDANYATFGAEAREFYEHYFDQNWNAKNGSNGYVLQRYLASADLHLGRARGFVELESAGAPGRRGGAGPNGADAFDPTEAFVQWNVGGGARAFAPPLALQAGRFGLNYGTGRVLSVNDGPGVRNAFDGVRAIVRDRAIRVDLFAARPVTARAGTFDDAADTSRSLVGAYVARAGLTRSTFEGYLLDDDRTASYERGRAHETRYTVGTRVRRIAGAFDGELESSYQFGRFGTIPISAYSVAGEFGYTARTPRTTTRASFGAGIASGDRGSAHETLGDYRPPTFKGQYFGAIGAIGPLNSVGLEPGIATTFDRRVIASVTYLLFARQSRSDAVYVIGGNLLVSGSTRTAADVSGGPLFSVLDRLDAHASVQGIYQRSYSGASLAKLPNETNIAYCRIVLDYKF